MLGFSATRAGVAFVSTAILMAAGATVSDRVAARVGDHRLVGAAMVVMALGIVSVSLLGRHASFVDLMPGFPLIGITIIGVVLTSRQHAEIRRGQPAVTSFRQGGGWMALRRAVSTMPPSAPALP